MIARHHGDERLHSRWRPTVPAGVTRARGNPAPAKLLDPDPIQAEPLDPSPAGARRSRALISIGAAIVIAAIATQQHHRSTSLAGLPSTPRQWVAQWSAASLDNPARVCQQLFAPALAAALKADTGRSCLTGYGSVTSRSFRVRNVFEDGPTAAVKAQQIGDGRRPGYFAGA